MQKFIEVVERYGLTPSTPVALAVSGGVDSISLCVLARQYFQKLFAITVDHRLRAESSQEAQNVNEILDKLNIPHKIVSCNWNQEVNFRKVQELARLKRYRLLGEECQNQNIQYLLTGHHLNDQIETFIFRLSCKSGIDGLSCMKVSQNLRLHFPPITLIRPLLSFQKTQLQEVCHQNKVIWIEDPSNMSLMYKRNQIRQGLAALQNSSKNISLTTLVASSIESFKETGSILNRRVINHIQGSCEINHDWIFATAHLNNLLNEENYIVRRSLSRLCQYIGGQTYPPLLESVIKLHMELKRILTMDIANDNKECYVKSIAGCVVFCINDTKRKYFTKSKNASTIVIIISRQPQKISMIPIFDGVNLWWDNRFLINYQYKDNRSSDPQDLFVRHMQFSDFSLIKKSPNRSSISNIHFRCRLGLPVIITVNNQVVSIPHFKYKDTAYFRSRDTEFYFQSYLKHELL
ncbi:tRNA(Ile)-lysidine synthase [Trichoplax sp. H2]|nr:tRNA(Ile)-lysidine synthase [Trichoplax sp. H2]|eukprot:RDD41217.1 tRNA(Ile)-lysidine synthase [Trichoplax sp. H2]